MTNKEKFIEVFGEELHRQYATKSWWEQEYVPPTLNIIKADVLDKISAEIEDQEKWLMQAGYNQYNVDIALDAIKAVVAKGRYDR